MRYSVNDSNHKFTMIPLMGCAPLLQEYIATLDAKPTIAQLNALAKGTVVEGALVVPKGVELMTPLGPEDRSRVRIVVSEGKKHEVGAA